jgi:hypothetical protein
VRFQRTTKSNTHKITFRLFNSAMAIATYEKNITFSAKLSFLPILLNGALANAPYGFFYEK